MFHISYSSLFSHQVLSDSDTKSGPSCDPMVCSLPGFSVHHYLTFMSSQSVMLSNHLILCHLLLLPSIFPSIRVFSNELALHIRWPNYSSFSISLSNEYSGLISFRIDWFDLLAVQGTLKGIFQHHSSKVPVLSFFGVQPFLWSNSHICTGLLERP